MHFDEADTYAMGSGDILFINIRNKWLSPLSSTSRGSIYRLYQQLSLHLTLLTGRTVVEN